MMWWILLYTNLIALTLRFWEELENFMRHVFELNFISFVKQQNGGEEMFFKEQEWVIGFFSINLLMELFINCLEPNGRDCWHNGKQLDECDVV
jgi:hypothetical protein